MVNPLDQPLLSPNPNRDLDVNVCKNYMNYYSEGGTAMGEQEHKEDAQAQDQAPSQD